MVFRDNIIWTKKTFQTHVCQVKKDKLVQHHFIAAILPPRGRWPSHHLNKTHDTILYEGQHFILWLIKALPTQTGCETFDHTEFSTHPIMLILLLQMKCKLLLFFFSTNSGQKLFINEPEKHCYLLNKFASNLFVTSHCGWRIYIKVKDNPLMRPCCFTRYPDACFARQVTGTGNVSIRHKYFESALRPQLKCWFTSLRCYIRLMLMEEILQTYILAVYTWQTSTNAVRQNTERNCKRSDSLQQR